MNVTTRLLFAACLVAGMTSLVGSADPKSATANPDAKQVVQTAPAVIAWLKYDEGIAKAKKESKPVVVDFTAAWCGWCKRMDRETFSDPQVISYMNSNVVCVKVWGDDTTQANMVVYEGERMTQRALTQVFQVRGFPHFWFLDSSGGKIVPTSGYKTKDIWMPMVEYIGGSHYKTIKYEDYIKKRSGQG